MPAIAFHRIAQLAPYAKKRERERERKNLVVGLISSKDSIAFFFLEVFLKYSLSPYQCFIKWFSFHRTKVHYRVSLMSSTLVLSFVH